MFTCICTCTHPLRHTDTRHQTHTHTHIHLHAHQPVCSSCQQASCLPVSPSVHGLESPLTTHTHVHTHTNAHTQSHFRQAGSWCLVANSLSGCLAGKILESQPQTWKDVNRIMKKVDFQVMHSQADILTVLINPA